MSIPFRCSSCGQEYAVADDLAGRQVSCRFCGELTRAIAPGGVAPATMRPRTTPSLHAPDLNALSGVEPVVASSPPAPQYSMDYIAPPPKIPAKPPKSSATSGALDPPSFDFDDEPSASPAPLPRAPAPAFSPSPMPSAASAVRAAPISYATPRSTPLKSQAERADVRLLLNDDGAAQVSKILLLAYLGGCIWFSVKLCEFVTSLLPIPAELRTRFYIYTGLVVVWSLVMFFVVVVPILLLTCRLAANWTKWDLAENYYLRAAGTAALPSVLIFGVIVMVVQLNFMAAIWLFIATPVLLVVTLKELMGLKWTTTLIAGLLLLFFFPLANAITSPGSGPVNRLLRFVSRVDDKSLERWAKDHPEEMKVAAASFQSPAERLSALAEWIPLPRRANVPGMASSSPPPLPQWSQQTPRGSGQWTPPGGAPTRTDPLSGRINHLLARVTSARMATRDKTREELKIVYDEVAQQINPLKPADPKQSPLWQQTEKELSQLRASMEAAPSETPPPEAFQPVENVALKVPAAADGEFVNEEYRFHNVRINPLKAAKVNVDSFLRGGNKQRWELSSSSSSSNVAIELELQPILDTKQQRPWVADRPAIANFASKKSLFAVANYDLEKPMYGRIGEIGWTRVTRVNDGREVTYVGRLPNQWLIVKLAGWRASEDDLAALDKFVQGIALVKDGSETTAPTTATAPAIAIRRSSPRSGGGEVSPAGGAGDVKALLAIVQGGGSSFDKRDALKRLAAGSAGDMRDQVAGVLEQLVVSDDAFTADDAADALAVMWRPQTVDVMLPLMDENVWPPSKRQRAMKVLAKTHDKRAVLPIMRWVLKDTDAVVAALIEMGPIAEDESINRLREKEPQARVAAARILSAVGTQKCMSELRRASKDLRDPAAAAAARSALANVTARVKPATAPSSPATTPAR